MGIDTVTIPKLQNSWPSMVACWANGAGMAHDIDSYGHAQTSVELSELPFLR